MSYEIKDEEVERFYPDPQDCDEVEENEEIIEECCTCGEGMKVDWDAFYIPDYGVICEYCIEKFRSRLRRR